MAADVETMFSARVIPWHLLGKVPPEELPRAEAIEMAGLGWTAAKYPIWCDADGIWTISQDRYGVVRSTDQRILGVVGPDFTIIQPAEQFEFVEAVLDNPEVTYDTAGMLLSATKAISWVCIKVNGQVSIGGDAHDPYLVIANGYDGSTSFKGMATTVRTVCANTLNMGWARASARFAIRHTTNVTGRIMEARRALGLTFAYIEKFEKEVEQLQAQAVTDAEFHRLVTTLLPVGKNPTKRTVKNTEQKQAALIGLWQGRTVVPFDHTAWGALAAVNEYELWQRPRGADDEAVAQQIARRQMRNLIGGSQPMTQQAAILLRR